MHLTLSVDDIASPPTASLAVDGSVPLIADLPTTIVPTGLTVRAGLVTNPPFESLGVHIDNVVLDSTP